MIRTALTECFSDPVVQDIKYYNDNTLLPVESFLESFTKELDTITEQTNKKEMITKIDNVFIPTTTQAVEKLSAASPKTAPVKKINSDLLRAVKSLNESQIMAKEAYANMDEAKYNASELKRRDSMKNIMEVYDDYKELAIKHKINLLDLKGYYDSSVKE